ncbi:MAG: hypothetical protein ABR82_08605 [Verrucomicrobia subdivision 6 bacterium BACL9 MAG-120507-bin52]|uniref:Uncharacterized protein n=1 Tax=Verrucomicrobia subdivision 6 bacterium BACL9 MAG-120507-bin52 TaxID=1655590 RepID=A0A0R2RIW7_9BACT|nr:MAG: hypothetical protein ABR82_08605 [Verrucomicrobia subdivision 6 bacterium BACL9 MAG-120507-bin52]
MLSRTETLARGRTRAGVFVRKHFLNFFSFSNRVHCLKRTSSRIASLRVLLRQAPTKRTGSRLRVYFPPFPAW